MKNTTPFFTVLALAGAVQLASAADITGKVTLAGTPPPEIKIQMDATCGKLHTEAVTTRHYVVGAENGLANVLVYLKSGHEGQKFEVPAETPLLDQIDCVYEPYVLGVMANQTFKVKNSDAVLHNVHATPKPGSGNKGFNFGQPVKGMVSERSFTNQEIPVRFKCDVHPWMFAYVGVINHPYHAVTDKDGNFKISNVPAGKYVVEAFHEKTHRTTGGITSEVTVDGDAKVDFTVELK